MRLRKGPKNDVDSYGLTKIADYRRRHRCTTFIPSCEFTSCICIVNSAFQWNLRWKIIMFAALARDKHHTNEAVKRPVHIFHPYTQGHATRPDRQLFASGRYKNDLQTRSGRHFETVLVTIIVKLPAAYALVISRLDINLCSHLPYSSSIIE